MRWFKHFTDNHRGRSVQFLMDKLGHKGLAYYLLLEMCAEKLEKSKGEVVVETDCEFYFHPRVVQSNLRLSVAGVASLLSAGAEMKLFRYEMDSNEIKIMMPMLLDLLEKNLKKRTPRSLKKSPNSPLDKEKDKDKDKEEEEEFRKKKEVPQKGLPDMILLWNKSTTKFSKVEKSNAHRNKKIDQLWGELSPDEWRLVFERMESSDFCTGVNDRGWRASFDWILQKDSYLKVLEGKYDNRSSVNKKRYGFERDNAEVAEEFNSLIEQSKSGK